MAYLWLELNLQVFIGFVMNVVNLIKLSLSRERCIVDVFCTNSRGDSSHSTFLKLYCFILPSGCPLPTRFRKAILFDVEQPVG